MGAGARQPLADRVRSKSEDLGNLRRLHAFDADEERNLAISRGQGVERALECELGLRIGECLERGAGRTGRLARWQITGKLGANLLRADPADNEAMADREQPRREPGIGRQLFGVGGEAHERFLQEVFGDVAAARHAHEVGVEPSTVRGEHGVEGGGISTPQPIAPGALVGIHVAVERLTCRSVTQKNCLSRGGRGRVSLYMLDFFRAGGFNMFPLAAIGIALLVTGIKFAFNADPQRLSMIRALTTTITFSMVTGVCVGLASTAKYVVNHPEEPQWWLSLLQGFAETMTNVMLGGGFVVVTWILVAVGVRRMPKENV